MHKRGTTAHIIVNVVQIKLPNGGLKSWKHEKQKTI